MGILNFLSKKEKLKKFPEKIWDDYTSNYFKKYNLALELRDMVIGVNNPDSFKPKKLVLQIATQAIIEKVSEIEKLIPQELVDLSEEELNLEKTMQIIDGIKTSNQKVDDIKYIMGHHEDLTGDPNKVVVHMKEALKILAEALKGELSLTALIKKDPLSKDKMIKLFQLIVTNERNLAVIFGSELEGEEFKKIERIVNAALTDSQIKHKIKRREREIVFQNDYKTKQRKNRLDKIVAYFNQMLAKLGEDDDFEIFYTQLDTSNRAEYGIFIRLKSNKLSDYLIIYFLNEDLDRRLRNDQIVQDYQLAGFEDRMEQGIRILKNVSK